MCVFWKKIIIQIKYYDSLAFYRAYYIKTGAFVWTSLKTFPAFVKSSLGGASCMKRVQPFFYKRHAINKAAATATSQSTVTVRFYVTHLYKSCFPVCSRAFLKRDKEKKRKNKTKVRKKIIGDRGYYYIFSGSGYILMICGRCTCFHCTASLRCSPLFTTPHCTTASQLRPCERSSAQLCTVHQCRRLATRV